MITSVYALSASESIPIAGRAIVAVSVNNGSSAAQTVRIWRGESAVGALILEISVPPQDHRAVVFDEGLLIPDTVFVEIPVSSVRVFLFVKAV